MIAKAKSEAKAAGEELRRKNEEELARMKQRATQEIEAAKQNAITELHDSASELASTMAAKILEREITAEDQQRLIEESLDQLAGLERA
jgi:F-type H+-transporting ATPase subunit b